MKKKSYRNLYIWHASVDVAARVLELTDKFPYRRLALSDQMQRAATSVPSNIAEGQGRLTAREERYFLGVARGSLHELDTQLEIAVRAGLVSAEKREELMGTARQVGAGINTLIRKLNLSITLSLYHSNDRLLKRPRTNRDKDSRYRQQ